VIESMHRTQAGPLDGRSKERRELGPDEVSTMKSRAKDRRRSGRHALVCPVTLYGPGEAAPVTTDGGDVSDGGVYVSVPASMAPAVGARVDVTFCVPRPARGLEVFAASARVVRRGAAGENENVSGVAMEFKRPLGLALA
jgi:hypothetical protein